MPSLLRRQVVLTRHFQADAVIEVLTALPRTHYLLRPYIPGHRECWKYTTPLNSTADIPNFAPPPPSTPSSPLEFTAQDGWKLAATMNKMWQHQLLNAQDPMMLEGPRPRGYLPVYTRSVLRPE
jgi:hypothetical protein